MVFGFDGSVSVRRFCASEGQPPPFLAQRVLPFGDTQLMIWPVRFLTLDTIRRSTTSRSEGRAPANASTRSYTPLFEVERATRPEFQMGIVVVWRPATTSPPVSITSPDRKSVV